MVRVRRERRVVVRKCMVVVFGWLVGWVVVVFWFVVIV